MSAVDRLELSRTRLRLAMRPPPPLLSAEPADPSLLQRLRHLPVVGLVTESVDAWWLNHPMRMVSHVAAQASTAVVRPVARLHPVAFVLVAAAVGALLVFSRPWRWALRPALLAGLAPQFASRVVAKLPIESWMTMLDSTLSKASRSAASGAHPESMRHRP